MIDVYSERLLTLNEARERFHAPPALATLNRWITSGVRGVVLESCLQGGRRYTSVEAIERFHRLLNARPELEAAGAHR